MAVYAVETITNLHVGDMSSSFSVVDKTVQRDALTDFPTIYASSMKGALRSAAEMRGMAPEDIKMAFGGKGEDISKGALSFNDARLLFYPVRSLDRAYYLATCPTMLADCAQLLTLCGSAEKAELLHRLSQKMVNAAYAGKKDESEKVVAEDWLVDKKAGPEIKEMFEAFGIGSSALVILSDKRMKELMQGLPVVARNQLNNGVAANLWYEEFVPRKSVFLLGIIGESQKLKEMLNTSSEYPIQVGANATVGYGLCRFATV